MTKMLLFLKPVNKLDMSNLKSWKTSTHQADLVYATSSLREKMIRPNKKWVSKIGVTLLKIIKRSMIIMLLKRRLTWKAVPKSLSQKNFLRRETSLKKLRRMLKN